jgi:heat shock protein HslJ
MAGLLLVLAGCGSGSGPAERGTAAAADVPAAGPPPLVGTEWQLTEILGDATAAKPAEIRDAVFRLDGEGQLTGRNGCNYFGGKVRVAGDRLEIGDLAQTDMACARGGVETAFMATLRGTVAWAVDGRRLRITGTYGRGLVFTAKASIYPDRDLIPLVQGQRDGGDYRLGWNTAAGRAWLEWEWRDRPGKPWESAGQGEDLTWTGPRPDPLAGSAGAASFFFGFIPVAAARVVYQPAGRAPATPLPLFTLPRGGALKAFGGFVDGHRPGAVVIAYRADGSELSRSVRLR